MFITIRSSAIPLLDSLHARHAAGQTQFCSCGERQESIHPARELQLKPLLAFLHSPVHVCPPGRGAGSQEGLAGFSVWLLEKKHTAWKYLPKAVSRA